MNDAGGRRRAGCASAAEAMDGRERPGDVRRKSAGKRGGLTSGTLAASALVPRTCNRFGRRSICGELGGWPPLRLTSHVSRLT